MDVGGPWNGLESIEEPNIITIDVLPGNPSVESGGGSGCVRGSYKYENGRIALAVF
jgi:hypothetical protein